MIIDTGIRLAWALSCDKSVGGVLVDGNSCVREKVKDGEGSKWPPIHTCKV